MTRRNRLLMHVLLLGLATALIAFGFGVGLRPSAPPADVKAALVVANQEREQAVARAVGLDKALADARVATKAAEDRAALAAAREAKARAMLGAFRPVPPPDEVAAQVDAGAAPTDREQALEWDVSLLQARVDALDAQVEQLGKEKRLALDSSAAWKDAYEKSERQRALDDMARDAKIRGLEESRIRTGLGSFGAGLVLGLVKRR